MEYLFKKERFDEYRNNEEIKKYLEKENLELLDKYEFEKINKYYFLISYLYSKICKSINKGYIKSYIDYSLKKKYLDFDIIFLMDKTDKTKNSLKGFLISQLGGCKKFKNAYSLNLICSKKSAPLLGAFLYMIKRLKEKNDKIDSNCILDLAGSFTNVKGLCAYNRFGFKPDKRLNFCFDDLTMSIDLSDYSYSDIINTVVSGKQKYKKISLDICNEFAIKDNMNLDEITKKKLLRIQKIILELYDDKYRTDNFVIINKYEEEISQYKKIFKNELENFYKKQSNVQSNVVGVKSNKITPINNDVQSNDVQNNITGVQSNTPGFKKSRKSVFKSLRKYTMKKTPNNSISFDSRV